MTLTNHNHHWLCSDVPGNYICNCGKEAYWNSYTQEIQADQTNVSALCYNTTINQLVESNHQCQTGYIMV